MFRAAWDGLFGKDEKMTSSKIPKPQDAKRPRGLTQEGLLNPTTSVSAHRRTRSHQAEQGAAVAMSGGPSQNLRTRSTQASAAATRDHDKDHSHDGMEKQQLSADEVQHLISQLNQSKKQVSSLQDELSSTKVERDTQLAESHTSQAKIAELEARANNAHQQTVNTEANLSQEIVHLKARVDRRDNVINRLNNDLTTSQHNANVAQNTYINHVQALQQGMTTLNDQVTAAVQDKDRMSQSLEDCKERVFKMLPLQAMTDDQISNSYRNLCESINNWVEATFDDVDNGLNTMIATMVSKNPDYDLSKYVKSGNLELAQRYPPIGNVLLAAFFLGQVYEKFLHPQRVFPGLPDEFEVFLNAVVEGLKDVKPAKDPETIEMWRVDLQRSLGNLKPIQDYKTAASRALLLEIGRHFNTILPPHSDCEAHGVECEKMIEAAGRLAHNIRLSTVSYTFQLSAPNSPSSRVVKYADLASYEIIDADTGLPLRGSSEISADSEGRVGEKLCAVRPALMRKGHGEAEDLVLVKAAVVVKFDRKVGKKQTRKVAKKEPAKQESVNQPSANLIDLEEDDGGVKVFV